MIMSILKFENRTPRDIQGMYNYMIDENKTNETMIFGLGVNPQNAVAEMKFVQYVNGRYNLRHEYKQIIFSFDVGVDLSPEVIKEVCMRIGWSLLSDERQVIGAIHGIGTEKVHCHYMINYVGIRGSLLRQEYSVVYYKRKVNEILSDYGLTPIVFYE